MIRGLLFPPLPSSRVSIGLLVLRVVAGAAMMQHGWGKIQNPFGWMGDALPGPIQACAALGEFGGGLGILVGCLTPLAAFGMGSTMAYAAYFHFNRGDPWVPQGPGASYELALFYFATAVLFMFAGPGRYSIDAVIGRKGDGGH